MKSFARRCFCASTILPRDARGERGRTFLAGAGAPRKDARHGRDLRGDQDGLRTGHTDGTQTDLGHRSAEKGAKNAHRRHFYGTTRRAARHERGRVHGRMYPRKSARRGRDGGVRICRCLCGKGRLFRGTGKEIFPQSETARLFPQSPCRRDDALGRNAAGRGTGRKIGRSPFKNFG